MRERWCETSVLEVTNQSLGQRKHPWRVIQHIKKEENEPKVVVHARVSTVEQKNGYSTPAQL